MRPLPTGNTPLVPEVNAKRRIGRRGATNVPKPKGRAMSLSPLQTVDELLADGLVQAVMRADHVEPDR